MSENFILVHDCLCCHLTLDEIQDNVHTQTRCNAIQVFVKYTGKGVYGCTHAGPPFSAIYPCNRTVLLESGTTSLKFAASLVSWKFCQLNFHASRLQCRFSSFIDKRIFGDPRFPVSPRLVLSLCQIELRIRTMHFPNNSERVRRSPTLRFGKHR